jgi:hypothetical protein
MNARAASGFGAGPLACVLAIGDAGAPAPVRRNRDEAEVRRAQEPDPVQHKRQLDENGRKGQPLTPLRKSCVALCVLRAVDSYTGQR